MHWRLRVHANDRSSPNREWVLHTLHHFYLKLNGSHFGLPPSSIHRMTGWVTNGACAHYIMVLLYEARKRLREVRLVRERERERERERDTEREREKEIQRERERDKRK